MNKLIKIKRFLLNHIIITTLFISLTIASTIVFYNMYNEASYMVNNSKERVISFKTTTLPYLSKEIKDNTIDPDNIKSIFIDTKNNISKVKINLKDKKDLEFNNISQSALREFKEDLKNNKISFSQNVIIINKNFNKKSILEIISLKIENFFNLIKPFFSIIFYLFAAILIYVIFKFFLIDMLFKKDKFKIIYPEDIETNFKNLIGLKDIKNELFQIKNMFKNRKLYKENGIKDTFNILLSGKPGTGKTEIVKAFSKEMNLTLISASGSNVVGKYQGSGSAFIKDLFKTARNISKKENKPVVVFLDEGQDLIKDRSEFQGQNIEERTGPINQLLQELDGINNIGQFDIIFFLASNFDETNYETDEAVMRRFSRKLKFEYPDFEDRKELIENILKNIDKSLIK